MTHEVIIESKNKDEFEDIYFHLDGFDFNKIRPMSPTLNIHSSLDSNYGEPGRILWVNELLGDKCQDVDNIYHSNDILKSIVVPLMTFSKGEYHKLYDKKIALAKKIVRDLPCNEANDRLHPYGYESNDISYILSGENIKPKCQADVLYLGNITLSNMIQYGAFVKDEWIFKNWGACNPINRTATTDYKNDTYKVSYSFKIDTGYSDIIPLLKYIVKYFARYKIKITYTFGTDDQTVTMVKPYDSNYFTEV